MRTELTLNKKAFSSLNVGDGESHVTLANTSSGLVLKRSVIEDEPRAKVRFPGDRPSARATLPSVLTESVSLPDGPYKLEGYDGPGFVLVAQDEYDDNTHVRVSSRQG